MEDTLQRYLDGITLLLCVVVGELFVPVSATPSMGGGLAGVGVGVLLYAAVVTYQRNLYGGDDAAPAAE